jgi:hypothetical protein
LNFPIAEELTSDQIFFHIPELAKEYGSLSERTLRREIEEFLEMGLLVKVNGDKYRANIELLRIQSPLSKSSDKISDGF